MADRLCRRFAVLERRPPVQQHHQPDSLESVRCPQCRHSQLCDHRPGRQPARRQSRSRGLRNSNRCRGCLNGSHSKSSCRRAAFYLLSRNCPHSKCIPESPGQCSPALPLRNATGSHPGLLVGIAARGQCGSDLHPKPCDGRQRHQSSDRLVGLAQRNQRRQPRQRYRQHAAVPASARGHLYRRR